MTAATVPMTAAEAKVAEWAVDPMEDYWAMAVEEQDGVVMPPMPRVERAVLHLPDHDGVVADLLYRLEEQLPDMADGAMPHERAQARADVRVGAKLAEKIRQATGYVEEK